MATCTHCQALCRQCAVLRHPANVPSHVPSRHVYARLRVTVVLDYFAAMDKRRVVPPRLLDTQRKVSEWGLQERRETEEERRVDIEGQRAEGEKQRLILTTPPCIPSMGE